MTKGLVPRLMVEWRRKLLLSVVMTGGFAAGYLWLEYHPLFPVTRMESSWLDRMIPFLPGAVYLYESLWLIMPIAPWLMTSRGDLDRYVLSLLFVTAIGFGIFLFFPTSCPRPEYSGHANALYRALISVDNEGNAFPSLHSALAVLSAGCCRSVLPDADSGRWLRVLMWIWAGGIVVSTLLTKQHVVIDAVAGIALGLGGYAIFRVERRANSHG